MNTGQYTYLIFSSEKGNDNLIHEVLKNTGAPSSSIAMAQSFKDLDESHYDFILLDFSTNPSQHIHTVSDLIVKYPDAICIAISDNWDTYAINNTLKAGAYECLEQSTLNEAQLKKVLHLSKERQDLEHQLEKQRNRFEGIVENNFSAILIVNENYIIQYATSSIKDIMGFTAKEVVGKCVLDYLHPDDVPVIAPYVEALMNGKQQTVTFKERVRNKAGNYMWMEVIMTDQRAVPGVGGMVANFRNIDKEEKANTELTKINQRFKIAAAATSDAIWDWNLETNDLYLGEGYSRLFGHLVENQEGHLLDKIKLTHPNDRDRVLDSLQFALNSDDDKWEEEYRFKRDNGKYAYVIDQGIILKDGNGNNYRMVGAMQDVTDQKMRADEREIFHELDRLIGEGDSLSKSTDNILVFLAELMGYPLVEAWVKGVDECKMHLLSQFTGDEKTQKFAEETDSLRVVNGGGSLAELAWQTGEVTILSDLQDNEQFVRREAAANAGLNTAMAMPLIQNGEVIAVLLFATYSLNIEMERSDEFYDRLTQHLALQIQKKKKEEDLNRFFQLSPDVLCVVGMDGYFKKINSGATEAYGYSEKELLSRSFLQFAHPDDRAGILELLNKVRAGKNPDSYFEIRIVTKTGNVRWLAWTFNYSEQEGLLYAVGKDITSQKRQEAELERVKNIQKYVINSTNDLIWAIDRKYKLLLGNESYFREMKRLSGKEYQLGEKVLSQTEVKWFSDNSRKKLWSIKYDQALAGELQSFILDVQGKGDEERQFQIELQPIEYHNNKNEKVIAGVACFSKDVTERIQHIAAIESQNEALREIAWNQSHVVRAPLARLLGLAELIRTNHMNEADRDDAMHMVTKSANELDEVLREIVKRSESMDHN